MTCLVAAKAAADSSIVALNPGSSTVELSLWIRTISSVGRIPASSRIRSASPALPAIWSTLESVSFFSTPLAIRPKIATTKTSHPRMAVLRCAALQRPSFEAMFCLRCMRFLL